MVNQKEIVENVIDRVEGLSQWLRTSGLHPEILRALMMNVQTIRDFMIELRSCVEPPAEPAPVSKTEEKKNPKPATKAPVFAK